MTVICDAGPPIHPEELGCLDLLADFIGIIVPDAVCSEVERLRPSVFFHPEATLLRTNATQPVPPELSDHSVFITLPETSYLKGLTSQVIATR